jgi:hypothetical protein
MCRCWRALFAVYKLLCSNDLQNLLLSPARILYIFVRLNILEYPYG